MGVWGSGNLESDSALDALGDKSDALIKSIFEGLKDLSTTEADEHEYYALFVDIEWLLALNEKERVNLWSIPEA